MLWICGYCKSLLLEALKPKIRQQGSNTYFNRNPLTEGYSILKRISLTKIYAYS